MLKRFSFLCFALLTLSLTPSAQGTTRTYTLRGKTTGWMDTRVSLTAGDIFTIRVSGILNIWPNCEETKAQEGYPDLDCDLTRMGPNGTLAFAPATVDYPFPGGLVGAVVARIGKQDAFLVGVGGTFVASDDGNLQLAVNDVQDMDDNVGGFTAEVQLPEPLLIGSEGWTDTGIVVETRQTVSIVASGIMNLWVNCEAEKTDNTNCIQWIVAPEGADGLEGAPDDYPLPDATIGALLAKIGDGPAFLVGAGGSFIAEMGGPLQFMINDNNLSNNEGTFSIITTIEPRGQTITIPGTSNEWLNSDIRLNMSDIFTIHASGILDIWPRCEIEKEGQGLSHIDCDLMRMGATGTTGLDLAPTDYPLPGGRVGALIGKVGNGTPFLVGHGGTFTADTDGYLQFRINDTFGMGDNAGGFVTIVDVD